MRCPGSDSRRFTATRAIGSTIYGTQLTAACSFCDSRVSVRERFGANEEPTTYHLDAHDPPQLDTLVRDWLPIATAPHDRDVLVKCGDRVYVARWREPFKTWGVSTLEANGSESSFADIREIEVCGVIVRHGPSHWMDRPAR